MAKRQSWYQSKSLRGMQRPSGKELQKDDEGHARLKKAQETMCTGRQKRLRVARPQTATSIGFTNHISLLMAESIQLSTVRGWRMTRLVTIAIVQWMRMGVRDPLRPNASKHTRNVGAHVVRTGLRHI